MEGSILNRAKQAGKLSAYEKSLAAPRAALSLTIGVAKEVASVNKRQQAMVNISIIKGRIGLSRNEVAGS